MVFSFFQNFRWSGLGCRQRLLERNPESLLAPDASRRGALNDGDLIVNVGFSIVMGVPPTKMDGLF